MRKNLGSSGCAAVLVATLIASGCNGATPPTAPQTALAPPSGVGPDPAPGSSTISGTVWVHAADGVKPFGNQALFGWVETDRGAGTTGRISIDPAGRYSLSVALGEGARVRILVVGAYQPCAVTLTPQGDLTHDVHVVTDPLQLGAQLPPQLAAVAPTLSGTVYEVTGEGRQPVKDARVELDGAGGDLVIATTLTDAEGRYLLCGVPHLPGLYLFASKSGFKLFKTGTNLIGQTTLDIELRR